MAKKVKKPITDEIAVVTKDIYQGYIGKTLINPDKTLQSESGGKGVEIYEDLLRDPEIRHAMQTRRLAVTGREWNILPATDDGRDMDVADFVEEVLLNCNFDQGRKALLSAIVIGFKPVEVMWEYSEGSVWINRLKGKASRRFTFDLDDNLRLLTIKNMMEGEEVPERKFQLFSWGSDNDTPFGYGLGSSLYWLDWFAKNSLKFWMIFADKFGSPTAIGKYPTGTPPEQQTALLSALEAIQQESAIKIPDTMVIELLEAARSSTTDTYEKLCGYLDKKKTKLILGQTLTSDVGKSGSYAASKTHNEVRQDYIKADADELCESLNGQLIKWIVDFNFPEIKKYPQVWIRTENEKDLKPLAARDEILNKKIGLPMTKKYFYETYGVPEPEEGDEVVTAPADVSPEKNLTPLSPPLAKGEGKGKGGGEFAENAPHPVDRIIGRLQTEADMSGIWRPIEKLVNEASSLEDLRDRLIDTYHDMDANALGNIMQKAMTTAELAGRFEAKQKTTEFAEYKDLPFDEAIDYFKRKINLPTKKWTDIWEGMHSRAFVVAGAMKSDLITDLRDAVDKGLTEGISIQKFRKDFDSIVDNHGWQYKGKRGWRTGVIFNTNMTVAYTAGRYKQSMDPDMLAVFPYRRYRTMDDGRVRPEHAMWNNTVLRYDDPWWSTHYPPNGWGCRCEVEELSKRQVNKLAQKEAISTKAPKSEMYDWTNKNTGEVIEVPKGIDPGWAYNPGETAWGKNLALKDMEKFSSGKWVDVDPWLPSTYNRPGRIPIDKPLAKLGSTAKTEKELRGALKSSIGGDEAYFTNPFGEKILVDQAIVDHILKDPKRWDGREAYFPFIRELIEQPFEVWINFAKNTQTGQYAIRERYIKAIQLDKKKGVLFIAESSGGKWTGFSFFRGDDMKYFDKQRRGRLLWGR